MMLQQSSCAKLLELTKKLISFKSITPLQNGCLDFLEQYLSNLGFNTQRIEQNDTSNLIAIIGNLQDSTIDFAFAGHIDVVPGGDSFKWKNRNPFSLHEEENRLYGRGIADMKGAVASFITALEAFLIDTQFSNNPLKSIALLITSDEEGSAEYGTTLMVEHFKKQNIKIKYCILGEPSSLKIAGDMVKIGRRGSLTGNLKVIGKQGHIAYPHLCLNPIHLFSAALSEIINIKWDEGNKFFPVTVLQFANLNSGLGVNNVIPGELYASFNIRYNNLHTPESLKNNIISVLEKYKLNYEIEWRHGALPFLTDSGKLLEVTQSAIYSFTQAYPKLSTEGGTSDGRFLKDICLEMVELGLTNNSIHQINESVTKDDLFQLGNIYFKILKDLFI